MREIDSVSTTYYPDSCLFHESQDDTLFIICGCYQLQESDHQKQQSRIGSIDLFLVDDDKVKSVYALKNIPGVLKLRKKIDSDILIGALSSGEVGIYSLHKDKIILINACQIKISETEMCLSISNPEDTVWYSTSDGRIGMCHLGLDELRNSFSKEVESMSTIWSVLADVESPFVAYSCSDFGSIYTTDCRSNESSYKFGKLHQYGVTHLSFPQSHSHFLCSSSFDESLGFWDLRNSCKPLSQLQVRQPIWNTHWYDLPRKYASLSCMLGGSVFISVSDNFDSFTEQLTFRPSQSLVYSTDVSTSHKKDDNFLACCTSFYDSVLHLWTF